MLLVSVSAPLAAAGHPLTKLVQGTVFGLALTLVVFAGAELFTGNTMVMTQGLVARRVGVRDVAIVSVISLVGNIVGSIGLAAMVNAGGTVSGPFGDLVAKTVASKNALSGGQLFWRAVLCNALVCLALWMARARVERRREARGVVVGSAGIHRFGLRALDRERHHLCDGRVPRHVELG